MKKHPRCDGEKYCAHKISQKKLSTDRPVVKAKIRWMSKISIAVGYERLDHHSRFKLINATMNIENGKSGGVLTFQFALKRDFSSWNAV
jgi:hypothetical protein